MFLSVECSGYQWPAHKLAGMNNSDDFVINRAESMQTVSERSQRGSARVTWTVMELDRLAEFGPDGGPVVGMQIPAADCAIGLLLDPNGQRGAELRPLADRLGEVSEGGPAADGERLALVGGQCLQVSFECFHPSTIPPGKAVGKGGGQTYLPQGHLPPGKGFAQSGMADPLAEKQEHRRLRLLELLAAVQYEHRYWFSRAVGVSDDYLSRLLYDEDKAGRKNIGDTLMTKMQDTFGLPPGWFDRPLGSDIPSGTRVVTKDGDVELGKTSATVIPVNDMRHSAIGLEVSSTLSQFSEEQQKTFKAMFLAAMSAVTPEESPAPVDKSRKPQK